MPTFDFQKAEKFLDGLLEQQEALTDAARGFGLRLAAYPRGLMPMSDAQKVVVGFAANTQKLETFLNQLYNVRGSVPPELSEDWKSLQNKAQKAFDKFQVELKAAQDALAKYEDILVGEHFQEAFEAVRHAVLDFDLADDVDIDFKTDLSLETNPAYGMGTVTIKKGATKAYGVTVGYRAVDDFYWGNIESGKRYKTFKNIVTKSGHTKLPKFVRELVEQVKAMDEADATGVFRSRRKIELTIQDPAQVAVEITPMIEARYKSLKPNLLNLNWSTRVTVDGTTATAGVRFNGYGWDGQGVSPWSESTVQGFFRSLVTDRDRLASPFTVTTASGTWRVTPVVQGWSVTLKDNGQSWGGTAVTSEADIARVVADRYPERGDAKRSLDQWRVLARARGIDPTPMGRSSSDIQKALLAQNKGPTSIRQDFTLRLDMVKETGRTAVERVARAYFQNRVAGGCDFTDYADGKDAYVAFRAAVNESQYEKGHGSYSGTIGEKGGFSIRSREPMTLTQAHDFVSKDINNNDKWGPAYAVPVTAEKLLKEEKVTVTVEARNDQDAVRQGTLRIKATGRVPPKASIVVDKVVVKKTGGGPRVSTYEVTGNRKQAILGEIKGWLFYGIASC